MSEDIAYRERRYLIMMGIRLVCFVIAVVLFVNGVCRSGSRRLPGAIAPMGLQIRTAPSPARPTFRAQTARLSAVAERATKGHRKAADQRRSAPVRAEIRF